VGEGRRLILKCVVFFSSFLISHFSHCSSQLFSTSDLSQEFLTRPLRALRTQPLHRPGIACRLRPLLRPRFRPLPRRAVRVFSLSLFSLFALYRSFDLLFCRYGGPVSVCIIPEEQVSVVFFVSSPLSSVLP
jgi:hypothetical protein